MENKKNSLRWIVAANIKRLIELMDISEPELAKRGCPQKTINNAKRGGNLELDTVARVARALGIPPWKLLVPDMNVSRAELQYGRLIVAYQDAPDHIKASVDYSLGLRPLPGSGDQKAEGE